MELSYLDMSQQMGALGVLSSYQINIATFVHTFVHKLGDVCASQLVEKSSTCWLASTYDSSMLLAEVLSNWWKT